MELRVKDSKGEDKVLNVYFMSFFKFYVLAYLLGLGIVIVMGYIILFIMGSYL